MAITFESIQDPYGIGQAGSFLGQALLQRAMEARNEQFQIAKEQRAQDQQKQYGSAVAGSIKKFQPNSPGESWDDQRLTGFMVDALESGAPFRDVLSTMRGLTQQDESAFRNTKESRLTSQHETQTLAKMYQSASRAIQTELKDIFDPKQKKELNQKIKDLHKEFSSNLQLVKKGKEPIFKILELDETLMPQNAPVAQFNAMAGEEPQIQDTRAQGNRSKAKEHTRGRAKVKWNPQDPSHQQRALDMLKRAQGDRALANKLMQEEFER